MLENPRLGDPTVPAPLAVSACFDKLEIKVNRALLESMKSHLKTRESAENNGEDTEFDRWVHSQIYLSEYNAA